jgi:uncharacterized phage protein gp47/JayE
MIGNYYFITQQGIIVPDVAAIQEVVVEEYKAAFGQDLVTTPDTPQGALIAAEVLARISVARNMAAIANQINPNVAEGQFIDSIWSLTGGKRFQGRRTLVTGVQLSGVAGAIIPTGALAKMPASDELFRLVSGVTLDLTGNAVGIFQAVNVGAIAVNAGALTQIVTGVLGWESVTNPVAGDVGSGIESDEQARKRRRLTLALQGYGTTQAISSRLNDIPEVKSRSIRENVTNAPAVIDGIPLVAHSVWVCVDGATDQQVAEALLATKSAGCNWNGATTVNVTDPFSGQVYPVTFDRPTLVDIMVQVTIKGGSSVASPIQAVKDAILAYANGLTNEQGFVLGTDVSAFELAGAVSRAQPELFVNDAQVALLSGSPVWLTLIAIAINEKAALDAINISVNIV